MKCELCGCPEANFCECDKQPALPGKVLINKDHYEELKLKAECSLKPANKFLGHSLKEQFEHMLSELVEVETDLLLYKWHGKPNMLADEIVDLQMSCETMLTILGLTEQQRSDARRRVISKNTARGYYRE